MVFRSVTNPPARLHRHNHRDTRWPPDLLMGTHPIHILQYLDCTIDTKRRSSKTRRNVMAHCFITRRNVMTVFHTSKKCVETCFRMCLKTCQIPACAMLKNVYVVLDFPASIPRSTSFAESLEVASMSRSYSTPRMSWRRTAYCICRCIWRRCCRIREETAMKPWSVGKCSGWQSFLSGFL